MTLHTASLILHIVLGLSAIAFSYLVLMHLLHRNLELTFLKRISLAAFLLYLASWLTAGYYYVDFYGKSVKPLVVKSYPWAHSVFMESKEHIFLFLPALSLVAYLIILFAGERLSADATLKRRVVWIAALTFLIGVYVTLSGVLVSGAAR